jgi:hypothetical protein
MKVEIREVTTMYCKNKSKLTRELRHKLESELEKIILPLCLEFECLSKCH